jgi:cytochrome P450
VKDTAVSPDMQTGVNLGDAQIAADRAHWATLRENGRVFQDTKGMYCVTSRAGVQYVLQHPELFSSAQAFAFEQTPVTLIPIAVDPPEHARYRRLLADSFAPRQVNRLQDDLRRQAGELIDAFADRGECDIMSELARLYPTQVFLTLFGMPLEDRDMCASWVAVVNGQDIDFTAGHGEGSQAVAEASAKMTGYLREIIKQKRANPTDDIFGRVVALTGEDAWTDDELLGFGWIFLLAGLDTVASAIGFLFRYLAQHPQVRQQAIEDSAALDKVIEEVLRTETVAPWVPRFTTQDVVVDGYSIPAGSFVAPLLAVANREPGYYPNPDRVDIAQADHGHFTFGGGAHRCIGSHLARSEMRIVVEEFHKRITDYQLAPGAEPTVKWPSGTINYAKLPIVFRLEGA